MHSHARGIRRDQGELTLVGQNLNTDDRILYLFYFNFNTDLYFIYSY
jgi:hypothetical protein